MIKSRKGQKEVKKYANVGAWVLIIVASLLALASYYHEVIGDKWTKVLEIVGSPFLLGLGFFVFGNGAERLKSYNEKSRETK